LVITFGDLDRDTVTRTDTSLEKLARLPPIFDRTSGQGTPTAGNSSPLTDGGCKSFPPDAALSIAFQPERSSAAKR
jgi:acetyl-CoA acetyltransferase